MTAAGVRPPLPPGTAEATPRLPAVHRFIGQDLNTALAARVVDRSDHPFIIWSPVEGADQVYSYGGFAAIADSFAAALSERNVKAGDHVLVMLDNCPELLVALFACGRLGAIAVTINARSVADEVSYFAEHSRSVIGLTQPSLAPVVRDACPTLPLVVIGHDSGVAATLPLGTESFDQLVRGGGTIESVAPNPARDLSVQYTSGTTARPKGVVWTHANALWGASTSARHTGLRADDVYLVHLPLFHTNALSYSALGTFWAGGTIVLVPKFSASRFWPVSLQHQCTVTSMIPFCVRALASQPIPLDHKYRTWGSPLCDPPSDAVFGVKSVGWWGMTETVAHGIVGDHDQRNASLSCGRPAIGYDLKILDGDGVDVHAGDTGALRIKGIRGISLFSRYLNDEEATLTSFDEDGFFKTGDRVKLLPDGHIQFSDRDKDMLKVAGENVAASEVERVVLGVPGVLEAAVVGRPDTRLFEVPVVFVIASPNSDTERLSTEILAECKVRLADFKVPRDVIFVDEFPRATLNKVAKSALRLRLLETTDQ
jgi:carnitine-CoA ligase